MKRNLGTLDRVIRIVIGVALIAAAATGQIGWGGGLAGHHPPGYSTDWQLRAVQLIGHQHLPHQQKITKAKHEHGRSTPANHAFRSNGKNP